MIAKEHEPDREQSDTVSRRRHTRCLVMCIVSETVEAEGKDQFWEEQHGAVLEVEERNAVVASAENGHTVQEVVCDHRYGKSVFSLCMPLT